MSNENDTHTRLTSAERNSIILNESRGIQHPLYYVCQTKSGKVQVRKRRTPLITNEAPLRNTPQTTHVAAEEAPRPETNYDSVSNRELLERMLDVLQKNVNSNDPDKNSVENERVTQENQQFIDNIVKANAKLYDSNEAQQPQQPPTPIQPTHKIIRRGRVLV